MVEIFTVGSTVDLAVLEEPAEVDRAGVVGQPPDLDHGGVVLH